MSEIEKYYNGEIIVDFEEETELEKEYNKVAELYSKAVKKKIEYRKEIERLNQYIDFYKDLTERQNKDLERLNNIINELEKLELYEFTPDYDYDENLVEGYTPFNIREYIQELKGSDK